MPTEQYNKTKAMDTQPPSELNPETINPNIAQETNLETAQKQQLKLEVEQLHREVQQLRLFFQTLVSGLIIATFLALTISSWFAYRLFIQEQATQREIEKAEEKVAEMESDFNQLRASFDILSQQLPEDLAQQSDTLRSYQRELQQLRDRLNQVEDQQRNLAKSVVEEKESN